jgi:chromosome partitioning protein
VVAILNQKGGVGKTSMTFHLGGALADSGQDVLMVDNDPQASLTQGLYGSAQTEQIPPGRTIDAVYAGNGGHELVRPTRFGRLSVVPGSWALADRNVTRPAGGWPEAQEALREFVREDVPHLARPPQWVLVDCPPNLQLLARAALIAADLVLVPLLAENYGAQGLAPVNDFAAVVRETANPGLAPPLYLINLFDRRCVTPRTFEAQLRTAYGERMMQTVVPRLADFRDAIGAQCPVTHYRPRDPAADAIRQAAEELRVVVAEDARRRRAEKAVTP